MRPIKLGILSDIHYASAGEQARGDDFEIRSLPNPLLRLVVRFYRHYIWLRFPLRQNHLLDQFLSQAGTCDYVIAGGDYSCDSANLGLSDDASFQSARECLDKLRQNFGDRFRACFGDHELGKMSLFGQRGGMRLASWQRARAELGLEPLWRLEIGNYVLLGVVSSLVALPLFEADILPGERQAWYDLRGEHMSHIRNAFGSLKSEQRLLLFCHDPSALPFLARERQVEAALPHLEQTIIGHLHSNLVLWKSRWLAGMPRINFLGHTARRLSTALNEARHWKRFHVRLCPSLAGVELLKDGGYYTAILNPDARQPVQFHFHRLRR